MTNDELLKRAREVRERADKATPGPWAARNDSDIGKRLTYARLIAKVSA